MIDVKIKRLNDVAIVPTKAHDTDACFDIYASAYAEIAPCGTVLVHTGIATEIPTGYWGAVFARSGLASKRGLRPANCVPVIDAPYRGEWMVPLHNDSDELQIVNAGDRIAQFMILPVLPTNLIVCDNIDESDRGSGGFGSTGT